MSKLSKGNWICIIVFVIVATFSLGLSCYLQGQKPVQKTATNPSISNHRFMKLYDHHKILNLVVMPKKKYRIDVSGTYAQNGHHKNFQSVTNAKQL